MAKQLAKSLGYIYVDSGAMYRTVTLYAINNGLINDQIVEKEKLINALSNLTIEFVFNDQKGYSDIYLNGKDVSDQIRSIEVSNKVSIIAAIPQVRSKLVAIQQEIGKNKGVVMDGRDIGSVVFPDAELKLFVTARDEVRAQRRLKELLQKGQEVSFEEILNNIQERDHIDSTRERSPLIQTEDAVVIDNSDMSIDEQNEMILKLAKARID